MSGFGLRKVSGVRFQVSGKGSKYEDLKDLNCYMDELMKLFIATHDTSISE